MPDLWLYAGETNPGDIKLSDPTVQRSAGSGTILLASTIALMFTNATAPLQAQDLSNLQTESPVQTIFTESAGNFAEFDVSIQLASSKALPFGSTGTISTNFDGIRQLIINGLDSAQAEANGWDAKRSSIPVSAVIRTSNTIVTITLPAIGTYDITAPETITATIPGVAVALGNPIVATPTFVITQSAAVGFTLTPGTGQLDLTGFSPKFPRTVVPGFGQLALNGFSPQFPRTVVSGSGQLSLTGFAPAIGLPKTIVPGFGQLALTGFAPTFARTIIPGQGALTLTGFSPTLGLPLTLRPGVGALVLDGFGPSLSFVAGGFTLQPGLGALTLTGFSPAIGLPRTLRPDIGSLTLSGFAPAIGLPYTLRPNLGQLTLTGFGPAIQVTPFGLFITPGTGQLTLTGYAPSFGSFTFRFAGGPVTVATITAGGVLIASISGGPTLTSTIDGGPV